MCISDFIKSAVCTILGAMPGLFLYVTNRNPMFLFVSFLGGFVGFGLSLRSTSISRVARLGVATIVENNIPYSFGLNDRSLESDSEDVKPSKVGWGLVGGIVVGALFILQIGLRMADVVDQQIERDSPVQALKNEEVNWNEKMKRGEDVPEAFLILANIEPANYKRYQEALRTKLALEKDDSNKQ